jgi:asparagine synthase (glutamine-hydrolysing)
MCGICGVVSRSDEWRIDVPLLERMRDTMVTRGPDDEGLELLGDESFRIGLGHRRLSIIDLSELGRNPLATADGRLRIVYNGEVFNYAELREELVAAGHPFRSQTDTEVVLYGVRQWGLEGCLRRLRGMYAFALFDADDRSLTLVRDPLGVKPLYWARQSGLFAFASEIKAILTLPWVERRLNRTGLELYLTFANVPGPETLFEGIRKLGPGSWLRLDAAGEVTESRYWWPEKARPDERPLREEEYVEELRRLLRRSVKRRMVSDVPFGVFLSGGVDSSLNVALMAEQMDRPVQTFSVGIEDDPTNEFLYARQVAERFGADHHETVIGYKDFIDFLPRMAYAQDEPLADPVCVPIYYVSKLARESGVPVIQVGEGSDEVFAGYPTFFKFVGWRLGAYEAFRGLPAPLRRLAARAVRHRAPGEWQDVFRRAAAGEPFFLGNAIAFWDTEKQDLLQVAPRNGTAGRWVADLGRKLAVPDPLLSIINIELKNRLPELLLMRVDKMSMAHSIETRVPFLDEDVVEFALKIPSDLKRRNGQPKYILKKAAEGILPDDVIYRRKQGFCGSATNMVTDRIGRFAREAILESPFTREHFRMDPIERLFERHAADKRFHGFKVWNLLNLVLWHDQWFGSGQGAAGAAPAAPPAPRRAAQSSPAVS